ncbi:DUF3955 domain-containing protein [Vagococcus vulneris]|uniref:DUF3955 domain-containing protein n=1 Tax=Vagococcus vulneris TaxID=1977869 RepID=A0A429ZUK2_9ENTE|nr:DUF3955 domain-containing protein [Vagococcus vulneris]RST97362.1 hypothetical protein CBF37_09780 [Vagococcus vulneris]
MKKISPITIASLTSLILGIVVYLVSSQMPSTIDSNGILHEPYFFMLPVGALLVCLGIILGAISFIRKMTRKNL